MTQERCDCESVVSLFLLTISKPLHPYVRNMLESLAKIPFFAANGVMTWAS
jgi:hypothetical protein